MGSELTTNDDTMYTHNKIANAFILRKTLINFIHNATQSSIVAIAAAARFVFVVAAAAAAVGDDFFVLI